MATVLAVGDIAIVHYNRSTTTRSRSSSCVPSRPAPPSISPTTAGWPPAASAPAKARSPTRPPPRLPPARSHADGLDLDAAGDQIIAYQGIQASPTILHLVDFADGNNTVAGDATDANTTALPPGFTLRSTRSRSRSTIHSMRGRFMAPLEGLFAALNNSANWLEGDALPPSARYFDPPHLDLACTRFRGHRVRCFDGTGGGSWKTDSLRGSSSLRL